RGRAAGLFPSRKCRAVGRTGRMPVRDEVASFARNRAFSLHGPSDAKPRPAPVPKECLDPLKLAPYYQSLLDSGKREADLKLQRYILGLALLAFTATQKSTFRQGCQHLPRGDPTWKQFQANGDESPWTPPSNIGKLVKSAANDFGVVQPSNQQLEFRKDLLK